jgi:hypothetical protein
MQHARERGPGIFPAARPVDPGRGTAVQGGRGTQRRQCLPLQRR